MTTLKDFPKLEDWSYKNLVAFYNKAISWKIDTEKELREMKGIEVVDDEGNTTDTLISKKEILGE